jgi:predicted O-methyltransferase YrrM
MSGTATPVTPAHLAYIRARTDAEGPFLESLRRAAVEAGIPPIAIAVEQGGFLATLVRLSRARALVEVGTLAGYSALWMARRPSRRRTDRDHRKISASRGVRP